VGLKCRLGEFSELHMLGVLGNSRARSGGLTRERSTWIMRTRGGSEKHVLAIICPLRGAGPEPEGSLTTRREIVLALEPAPLRSPKLLRPGPPKKGVAVLIGHSPDKCGWGPLLIHRCRTSGKTT
jgi:hypothetical protein